MRALLARQLVSKGARGCTHRRYSPSRAQMLLSAMCALASRCAPPAAPSFGTNHSRRSYPRPHVAARTSTPCTTAAGGAVLTLRSRSKGVKAQRLTAYSALCFFQAPLRWLPGNVGHASVWVVPSRDAGSRCTWFRRPRTTCRALLHSTSVCAPPQARKRLSHPLRIHRPLLGIGRAVLMHWWSACGAVGLPVYASCGLLLGA